MIPYSNPWFRVVKDGRYYYIEETGEQSGAAVLPIWGDNVVLLQMNRVSQGCETFEIPRGYAESGETTAQCATRELLEETGLFLDPTAMELLGFVRPNTGLLRSRIPMFLARISAETPQVSRDAEATNIILVPLTQLDEKLRSGLVEDSFTLSALAMLNVQYSKGHLSPA